MNDTERPRLSVIIPAYNEEPRIGGTLEKIIQYFSKAEYSVEVVVVDDGSTDRTIATVEQKINRGLNLRILRNERNLGKGAAVRHGMLETAGQVRLFFDADGSTPIDQVEKVWTPLDQGADICLGSRTLPGSNIVVHQPWHRELMGRVFNLMVRLLAVGGFSDTQCGFKAFSARAAEIVFGRQQLNGFGFDVELLYIARKHGLRAAEVPVTWIDSPQSRVHPWRDARRMFFDLLRIRWHALKGLYR